MVKCAVYALLPSFTFDIKVLGETWHLSHIHHFQEGFQEGCTTHSGAVPRSRVSEMDLVRGSFHYGMAMQKGGLLVVAEVDDDKAYEALSSMRRGALSLEPLLEEFGN